MPQINWTEIAVNPKLVLVTDVLFAILVFSSQTADLSLIYEYQDWQIFPIWVFLEQRMTFIMQMFVFGGSFHKTALSPQVFCIRRFHHNLQPGSHTAF